ncbi:hypothetical protein F4677DRAFT_238617 [Hypoxylon crocopeplum]|nr:hypothetical protein F4677DRAFT_238617 [Hypoxylon crocopeplum]
MSLQTWKVSPADDKGSQQTMSYPFQKLPPELQNIIWEFTLPSTAMARSTTVCPVVEIPEPPVLGRLYGRIPAIKKIPPIPSQPTALYVCRRSREVAFSHFIRFRTPVLGQYSPFRFVWRNDILDLGATRTVADDLIYTHNEHKDELINLLNNVKQYSMPRDPYDAWWWIDGDKFL